MSNRFISSKPSNYLLWTVISSEIVIQLTILWWIIKSIMLLETWSNNYCNNPEMIHISSAWCYEDSFCKWTPDLQDCGSEHNLIHHLVYFSTVFRCVLFAIETGCAFFLYIDSDRDWVLVPTSLVANIIFIVDQMCHWCEPDQAYAQLYSRRKYWRYCGVAKCWSKAISILQDGSHLFVYGLCIYVSCKASIDFGDYAVDIYNYLSVVLIFVIKITLQFYYLDGKPYDEAQDALDYYLMEIANVIDALGIDIACVVWVYVHSSDMNEILSNRKPTRKLGGCCNHNDAYFRVAQK